MYFDNYNLSLHTYSDHVTFILREMMTSKDFADVTLVTEDKKHLRAHRYILSACSSVFKNILEIDPHNNNPLIYLKGIEYLDMESILNFIYLGEAKFQEERMDQFLLVAKSLDIKVLGKSENIINTTESTNEAEYVADVDKPNLENEGNFLKAEDFKGNQEEESTFFMAEDSGSKRREKQSNTLEVAEDLSKQEEECNILLAEDSKSNQEQEKNSNLKCHQCNKTFTRKRSCKEHIKSVHEGLKYDCNECGKSFKAKYSLQTHLVIDHSEPEQNVFQGYQGDPENFKKVAAYFDIDIDESTAKCKICSKSLHGRNQYGHVSGLRIHLLREHKLQREFYNYYCSNCGKIYTLKSQRDVCEAKHGNIPYKITCSHCQRGFMDLPQYKRHLRTHTEEKPHQCNECGRRFREKSQLKTHMVIHTGETPFECTLCKQKFKFVSTKNNHKCVARLS